MGPSNADKAEMTRLLKIMNGAEGVPAVQQPQQAHYSGGYAGTQRPLHENRAPQAPAYMPSFGTSREEVNAMKTIMEKINHLSGDDRSMDEVVNQPQTMALTEASHFTQVPMTGSGPYEVLAVIKESNGKEVNRYSVVDSNRQDVVGGLTLKEAATALMKLLNKGLTLESARVQEVIDLEEDYNRSRLQTVSHKQRYTRSMELGEAAAAQVFKDRFNVAKANALAAQDDIKSILESIR
jgi:hypothetical protein